jgi:hypothetical protein
LGLTYHFADGILRFVPTGDVDFAETSAVLRAGFEAVAVATPGLPWHLMFDLRDSTSSRSADELRGVAGIAATHRAALSGRCVVVATDPLRFGLARMMAVFFETAGFEANVLRDPAAAEAWLTGSQPAG